MAKQSYLTATQIADHVNQKFGAGTMIQGSKAYGLVKPRFSTGSLALDIVTNGGAPEGGIEVIEGEEGSSKSWNLHTRAANFLKKYPEAAYIIINAEGTNDPPFLEMLGCDLERTWFVQPDSGEQAWDVAHEIVSRAAKVYVGVDSLDQMVPLAELEKEMDESNMAPAARMNNRGFRKLIACMKTDLLSGSHRVSVGVITQLRTNIGVMFGDNKSSVGGRGKAFAAMTIIRYRRVKSLRTEGKTALDKIAFGLEIEAEVIKNKGPGQGEKVRFNLYKENYDGFRMGQIDNVTELMPFLVKYGLIQQAGAWFVLEGKKYQGEGQVSKALRADADLCERLCEEVKALVAKRHTHTEQTATPKKAAKKTVAVKGLKKVGAKK